MSGGSCVEAGVFAKVASFLPVGTGPDGSSSGRRATPVRLTERGPQNKFEVGDDFQKLRQQLIFKWELAGLRDDHRAEMATRTMHVEFGQENAVRNSKCEEKDAAHADIGRTKQ